MEQGKFHLLNQNRSNKLNFTQALLFLKQEEIQSRSTFLSEVNSGQIFVYLKEFSDDNKYLNDQYRWLKLKTYFNKNFNITKQYYCIVDQNSTKR